MARGFEGYQRLDRQETLKRNPGLAPQLQQEVSYSLEQAIDEGRSDTCRVRYFNDEGRLLFWPSSPKDHHKIVRKGVTASHGSTVREADRNPDTAFRNEVRCYQDFHGTEAGKWFAELLEANVPSRTLYLSEIEGESYRDRLSKAHNTGDEEERNRLIVEAAHHYGLFGGILSHNTAKLEESSRYSKERRSRRLKDYLAIIVKERFPKIEGSDADILLQRTARRVKAGINITSKLDDIVKVSYDMVNDLRTAHGDARPQHMIIYSRRHHQRFVLDPERTNIRHPRITDLVTLTSMEAGISRPSEENLPFVVATFLASYNAGVNGYRKKRRNRKRNRPSGVNTVRKHIRQGNYKQMEQLAGGAKTVHLALLEYLAMDIEENLHLDATNRRMGPDLRRAMCSGIQNWNEEDMLSGRMNMIQKDFDYITTYEGRLKKHAGAANYHTFRNHARDYAILLTALGIGEFDTPLLESYEGIRQNK